MFFELKFNIQNTYNVNNHKQHRYIVLIRLKVDDPVGAIAVHGVNGLFGTIAVGFFAKENGLFFGGSSSLLITQIIGVVSIATFSFLLTYVVMNLIKLTMGIRISEEEEKAGIDAVSFGVKSYTSNE